ncbi:MAG: hypothetical protein CL908_21280 [Deltaproteobacteria bacterium]|nr:hypothetical protein [Deltaproteobacteria bacterium]
MTPPRSPTASESAHQRVRRRAPLNSVSTRIVLCVFASTLLTALIVSWLSVGAIHADARRQIGQRTAILLGERGARIEAWRSAAAAQLASSSAIAAPWHSQIVAALPTDLPSEHARLDWLASDFEQPPGRKTPIVGGTLPAPPAELARFFDRLAFRVVGSGEPEGLGCLSARVDLVGSSSKVLGGLQGCLSRRELFAKLHSADSEQRGLRMLVADGDGLITAAAGIRAQARTGQQLPMARLLYPGDGQITEYEDAAGNRLVGNLATIGRSGWVIAAETEHARAFAAAIAITNQIFIVDVCIILLFSVLAYKITLAIMQPIEALSQGAQRISEGHVNHQIPTPANNDDELGLLTHTFNEMMKKLRSNQLEIEQDRLRLAEKNEELQRANEILAQLSITDGLTKLHNHRYFQDHLTREIKRVSRTMAPLSLILLDIDDFKLLNDTHGHAAGDEVLMSLASVMNDSARESDLIARYGGEEFVVLMPNTDLAGAVHLAEKIRMAVESTRLIIGDSMKPIEITISLGVALYHDNRREFFAEADRALYRAKAAGKNCVIIAGSNPL